jgi:phosphonate transport system substrate-binding protein
MPKSRRLSYVLLVTLLGLSLVLAACQPAATESPTAAAEPTEAMPEPTEAMPEPTEAMPEPTATEVMAEPTATEAMAEPTATEAAGAEFPEDLGTEENPIIWAVVPSGETEEIVTGFQEVADMIFDETGLVIEPLVATEYAGVIEAMCSEPPQAQMGSLATFAYILAAERGCAEAAMVAERFGSPTYNGQIIVRADSGIDSIDDLAGKSFCRPDPLSTSGWIIPSITLRAAGIDPDTDLGEVVDAGSHDAVVTGVYNGQCDAGSTFVDARTAVEDTLTDVMEAVVVLETSIDIPNDGVQFVPGFPEDKRQQIIDALLAISQTEEGQAALETSYEWDALVEQGDAFYDPFRQVLDAAGVNVEELQ